MSEADSQKTVIEWARWHENRHPALRYLFHPANGEYRHPATAARLKAMGVRRGVPDLMLPLPNDKHLGLAVEMKCGRNKPTEEQHEWLGALARAGWRVEVCWNAQAAIDCLSEYLGIEPPCTPEAEAYYTKMENSDD